MKKVGIITFHNVPNYGAFLQAYALQTTLSSLNYDSVIINYINPDITNRYMPIDVTNFLTLIKSFFKIFIKPQRVIKYYIFQEQINKYMVLTDKIKSRNDVVNEFRKFDVLITGSDQVWNSDITNGLSDLYTLNINDKNIKKISYAASVGKKISENQSCLFEKKLANLNHISVREKTTKQELSKIIKEKEIFEVIDPTLLLRKAEWDLIISNIESSNFNNKYILIYELSPNDEFKKIVNNIQLETGLPIYCLSTNRNAYKNCKYKDLSTPFEFVNYIKNAEYVITTSFHATVFSIIFNKKFFVVPHKTTGSRVTDLLKKLDISSRAVSSLEKFKMLNFDENIDYKNVNKILEKEREKSINWLIDAIEK